VAHAGFQAEGGPGSPVDPNSDWYKWVHDPTSPELERTPKPASISAISQIANRNMLSLALLGMYIPGLTV
jgi:beta-glucosidase/6-phospho-beta-glucosidase/beta-galactosidase